MLEHPDIEPRSIRSKGGNVVARMENRVEAIRQFHSPFAPGICLMGARLKPDARRVTSEPINVFGKGASPSQALTRLWGEAAERDALYLQKDDDARAVLDGSLTATGTVSAVEVLQSGAPDDLGSTGCAAHNLLSRAAHLAVCELIERFAVLSWWRGQTRPVALMSNWSGHEPLMRGVSALRHGARAVRLTRFFSLGRHGAIHTVMARSGDLDGSHIAVAFAASDRLDHAARRSFLELLSVELEVAEIKATQAEGREIDRDSDIGLAVIRQEALRGTHAHLLHPQDAPIPKDADRPASIADVLTGLSDDGLQVRLIDLTREDTKLPVCRAMFASPDLQPKFPKGYELSPL